MRRRCSLLRAVWLWHNQNRGQSKKDQNKGQSEKQYRQFNENQRQYANTYYKQHQGLFGQDKRWNNDYENRLQPGYVLDKDMRKMSRPAPNDLTKGLGLPLAATVTSSSGDMWFWLTMRIAFMTRSALTLNFKSL